MEPMQVFGKSAGREGNREELSKTKERGFFKGFLCVVVGELEEGSHAADPKTCSDRVHRMMGTKFGLWCENS